MAQSEDNVDLTIADLLRAAEVLKTLREASPYQTPIGEYANSGMDIKSEIDGAAKVIINRLVTRLQG
jgi:hypothetical protein